MDLGYYELVTSATVRAKSSLQSKVVAHLQPGTIVNVSQTHVLEDGTPRLRIEGHGWITQRLECGVIIARFRGKASRGAVALPEPGQAARDLLDNTKLSHKAISTAMAGLRKAPSDRQLQQLLHEGLSRAREEHRLWRGMAARDPRILPEFVIFLNENCYDQWARPSACPPLMRRARVLRRLRRRFVSHLNEEQIVCVRERQVLDWLHQRQQYGLKFDGGAIPKQSTLYVLLALGSSATNICRGQPTRKSVPSSARGPCCRCAWCWAPSRSPPRPGRRGSARSRSGHRWRPRCRAAPWRLAREAPRARRLPGADPRPHVRARGAWWFELEEFEDLEIQMLRALRKFEGGRLADFYARMLDSQDYVLQNLAQNRLVSGATSDSKSLSYGSESEKSARASVLVAGLGLKGTSTTRTVREFSRTYNIQFYEKKYLVSDETLSGSLFSGLGEEGSSGVVEEWAKEEVVDGIFRLSAAGRPELRLNVNPGTLVCSPVPDRYWDAMWFTRPGFNRDYVVIANRHKTKPVDRKDPVALTVGRDGSAKLERLTGGDQDPRGQWRMVRVKGEIFQIRHATGSLLRYDLAARAFI